MCLNLALIYMYNGGEKESRTVQHVNTFECFTWNNYWWLY